MKIDTKKLDVLLARQCKSPSDLQGEISRPTLWRIQRGEDVRPKTAGRLANALGVDVTELIGDTR